MPKDSQSGNVKVPKLRTKTFTGCWTCRNRRVKCDDERPHCRRCQRSGWQCQGYGLRLGWSQTPGSRSQRRQILSSTPQSTNGLSSASVTALLAELDGCSDGSAQHRGPFSVFSASGAESMMNHLTVGSNHVNVDDHSQLLQESKQVTENPSPSISNQDKRPSPVPSEPIAQADGPRSSAVSSISQLPARSRGSATPESHQKFLEAGSSLADISFLTTINPVQLPRPETELVHHWVVFLSGKMLLLDSPDNPCRTVFMPLALKGLDAAAGESNIHLSIFHAICASSAFSLYHLRRDFRYQSLAMHHDQLALRHLRGNLGRAKRFDEPTLAAVLSCITAEAMSGRRSRWRAHVAGGLGLLENEIACGWMRSPTNSRLLQSYLSLSSLCSLPMSTQLISLLNGPCHYLERSHGVTTQLVQFLAQLTTILDSESDLSTEELDRLELQLYLNFPCLSSPDDPGSTIIQHALNTFYYATIIYFRRTLRRVPLCEVQELVEKAVQELEAVDTLKNNQGGCAYNWASFVVAAECQRPELQSRMLAWFDRKSQNGIQNVVMLCEIVRALWERRDYAKGRDVQWQEIANEADFDIMLV
ncbi:hypothetical protein N7448_009835 [Penicillium atrosanguineum]|uniref:uncharacterized protein n=1 Tax=Penicillium atrosanguineum TaxID=1132637 RepID=UPI00238FAF65|nr:uncharacterized protein N7443_007084 [Penicillium atrosanguineum]KAJ5123738.1 hypothetical protein N7448_009835 [Penicillium atrosanguineum]KAJ5298964.1 hypothetical protein N7443_007084 [Penicillium atrosanguineum]